MLILSYFICINIINNSYVFDLTPRSYYTMNSRESIDLEFHVIQFLCIVIFFLQGRF